MIPVLGYRSNYEERWMISPGDRRRSGLPYLVQFGPLIRAAEETLTGLGTYNIVKDAV